MCNCNNNNNSNCGCSKPKCTPAQCGCSVYISSDCVSDVKSTFPCLNIESNLTLTETLEAIDQAICDKLSEITNYISLVNVGDGAQVYKGVNGIGQKEIRSIIGSNLITVNQDTTEIQVSVDEEALLESIPTYSAENLGEGASIYSGNEVVDLNTSFKFKTITSEDNSVTISSSEEEIDLSIAPTPTSIDNGITTTVTGAGTSGDPYVIETTNLQKTISGSTYTLTDNDDNYTLIVNNGSTPITITVPTGLKEAFNVGFIQRGTADVTFVAGGGVTINTPISGAYKIKGQNYNAHLEQYGVLPELFLIGNLKI